MSEIDFARGLIKSWEPKYLKRHAPNNQSDGRETIRLVTTSSAKKYPQVSDELHLIE